MDFIKEHFLIYNSFTDKCFWETPPTDSGLLKAAKRTCINALFLRKIKLGCVGNNNVVIGTNTQMKATINSPHGLIRGPPGIIKLNKEGIAYTVILFAKFTLSFKVPLLFETGRLTQCGSRGTTH
jgi:hypothetical protein